MNPTNLAKLGIGAIGAFVTMAAILFGCDQRNKREEEQERNRENLLLLEKEIAAKEHELALLRKRLGEKNEQVRVCVAEITQLRAKLRVQEQIVA